MIRLLFLYSVFALIFALIASLFIKKHAKAASVVITVLSGLTLFFMAAALLERYAGGRISFLQPWMFLALLLPLSVLVTRIFFYGAFTRRINYPMTEFAVGAGNLRGVLTRWLPLSLYAAALVSLTVALARPVTVDKTVLPPTQGIDIILLMDTSASMQRQDFTPNRFEAARRTASNFISKRFNDRIGLVAFARAAMLQAPLTLDHDALQEFLQDLYLGMVDPNYTAIGDALGVAANHLKDSKAKSKVIILLTDGASNAGAIDPVLAAKAAAAYGIRVYTVATASPPGTNIFSSAEEEIDEGLLMEIAKLTGGKFYRAKNELELAKIYDTINELEKTEFTQSTRVNQSDFYQPFVMLGLLLLMLGFVLEQLFFIKVP